MSETASQLVRIRGSSWDRRTYKREVAIFLLLFWMFITVRILWMSVELMNASMGVYGIATPAVFAFALGAFGLDAFLKQGAQQVPAPPPLPRITPVAPAVGPSPIAPASAPTVPK